MKNTSPFAAASLSASEYSTFKNKPESDVISWSATIERVLLKPFCDAAIVVTGTAVTIIAEANTIANF